ncbi:MAG TPA: alpha/beta hydrolase, partial [Verrucomicrobiae bacterium]|nr:alpha/beta hydrolase [Verrucomicrobiae bacterium]
PHPSRRGVVSSVLGWLGVALLLFGTGCSAPIGADKSSPGIVYQQIHGNVIADGRPGGDTLAVLHRFDQEEVFKKTPDATLQLLHQKAVESGDRDIIFALSELNFLTGEKVRRSVKPWEPRDARDYYLASAVYAWFFLGSTSTNSLKGAFDSRFRAAGELYNCGLGWALTGRRSTNSVALLGDSTRLLAGGHMNIKFSQPGFPWSLSEFKEFVLADHFLVRGLSVRNRQTGMGAPLVAVTQVDEQTKLSRSMPATAFLRIEGRLADMGTDQCRGSLELYSPLVQETVQVGNYSPPLEADTTLPLAYGLNQSSVWSLGRQQFLSGKEQVPSDVYLSRPYQPGRVPVVFVHGTFSSPVWWAEMMNTLSADPVLRQRCQFWYFIYNSGNPVAYSATRLREALTAKIRELDPDGKDPALQHMVVIGHSQGGLLAKLTATDTGDKLWRALNTNRLEDLKISPEQQALIRKYVFYEALPFVKGVVFISTPHRGSYQVGNLLRNLAYKLVELPETLATQSKEFIGLYETLHFPKELSATPTSLDGMSPKNPFLLALAKIPLAPGVEGHSIISVQGDGDYHEGTDGVVSYQSAHVDYVKSEFIVHSFHSCLSQPATIEEVRRILREYVAALPALPPAQPAPEPSHP